MINPFFMFATGIENSIPMINGARTRIDQMEKCGFYEHWRTDFALVEDLGIRFLRYGLPLHRTHLEPERFDWEFADATLGELTRRDIVPILDLCHFGVPDWIGNFQNPEFPELFARYAGAFARRFPGSSSTLRSTRCSSARPSPASTGGGTSRGRATGPS